MIIKIITRIKIPRSGSLAKACTEFKIPDLTRKVPSKLKEKVIIANKLVQLFIWFFNFKTNKEWIRAVPANQGIREAFSTGSQNQ